MGHTNCQSIWVFFFQKAPFFSTMLHTYNRIKPNRGKQYNHSIASTSETIQSFKTSITTNQRKERERITTYLEEEELQPGRTMNHQQEEEPEARSSVREEVICLKKRQRKKENEEAEGEGEQRRRKKHKRRKVCDSYGRVNIALFILYR